MEEQEIKRMIELLMESHNQTYICEGVCFLNTEEEKELNDLIERYNK